MSVKARIVSALWFMLLVSYLERVTISIAGPTIMKSLGLTPAAFGIVLSSFAVGYGAAQIPGGLLSDRWGAKAMLIIGPFLWALFTGLTGLVATVTGFVVVRFFFGAAEGISATSYYQTVGENFHPKERAAPLAIVSTATALAPAFAGALVGKLISAEGWRTMFVLMIIPSLLTALVTYLLMPGRDKAPAAVREFPAGDHLPFRALVRQPSLWLMSLAAVTFGICHWGYIGWMPSYLALERHIELKSVGAVSSIPYIFAFFGLLFGGWLGSTILHRHCAQLAAALGTCAGLSLVLAYQANSLTMALAGLSGAAFFLFGCHAPLGKSVLELAPQRSRAAYAGIYNTATQIGGAAAPAVIGYLVGTTGSFAAGFGFMIAAFAVGAVSMLALAPYLSPKPQTGVVLLEGVTS